MTTLRRLFSGLCLGLLAIAGFTGAAAAQDYPNRPIELMVAFAAGGSTDAGARIVAGIAEKLLGQPLIVLNRGGAGGQVGWTEISRQKPEGHLDGKSVVSGKSGDGSVGLGGLGI